MIKLHGGEKRWLEAQHSAVYIFGEKHGRR